MTEMNNKPKKNRRTLRSGLYTVVVCAIVLAIVVFVNLIITVVPSKFAKLDVTTDKLYSTGETTEQVLETVKEDVTIYHLYEEGQNDGTVSTILERYPSISSHVKVTHVDPGVNPTFTAQFTEEQLTSNSLIVVSSKRNTVVDYDDMYKYYLPDYDQYVSYAEYQQYAQYMQMYGQSVNAEPYFFGEQEITSAIDYVTTDNLPVIYYTALHGESELPSVYTESISKENIELKSLDLISTGKVPEDAEAVIIYNPTNDFTEDETTYVLDYMKAGGDVILVTGFGSDVNGTLKNIAAMNAELGLAAVDGMVFESDAEKYYPQMPYMLFPTLNPVSEVASAMQNTNVYIYVPQAHGIVETGDGEYTVTPILTTSDSAYIKTAVDATTEMSKADGDIEGEFMVGASVTVADANAASVPGTKTGHFVWYSSAAMLDAQLSSYGNSDLFISTVNTTCEKTVSISIIGKSLGGGYLEMNEAESITWVIIVSVIVPLFALVLGIVIWAVRRRK